MSILGDFFKNLRDNIFPKKQLGIPERTQARSNWITNDNIINHFEDPRNYNEYCQEFFSHRGNLEKQYDYFELISLMQSSGAMAELERYLSEINDNSRMYYPSDVHGIDHTSRVTFFAEALCYLDGVSAHDRELIMRAAEYHDIGREDDNKNIDHGLAGRLKIERFGLLSKYPERDQDIIKFAVECHSLGREKIDERLKALPKKDRKDYKIVLDYLQNADKLDRTRIANKGWGLDPNRLTLDTAKKLVKVAHINFFRFNTVINRDRKRDANDLKVRAQAFYLAKQHGFNIDFDFFNEIADKYKPGTIEMLLKEGKIDEIFSYQTFLKYKLDTISESLVKYQHDVIFKELNNNNQISQLESSFNSDFMLLYNLKTEHTDAYNLYKYVDVDLSHKSLVGVATHIKTTDLDKFYAKGYYLRMCDLYDLAANLTPTEYQNMMDSGNIEEIFSSKYEKNPQNYEYVQERLARYGINYSKDIIDTNYRFIEKIVSVCPSILKDRNVSNYSFSELYTAITKLSDVSTSLSEKSRFLFGKQDIFDLMNYLRSDTLIYNVTEREQLNIVKNFVHNKEVVKDPRYVQYMLKRNRPYDTNNIEEILNYNEFCADSILVDRQILLADAKSKLINALFNIDVPPESRRDFEKELEEELYFHKKYFPNSELYQSSNGVLDKISEILGAKDIEKFRNLLYENKKLLNTVNTHALGNRIKEELLDISKGDITYNLQKTAYEISLIESSEVYSTSGIPVRAKVLSGQNFYLATTTIMPKCSSRANKIMAEQKDKARDIIYRQMLEREYNPNQKCTSIISEGMIGHAKSSLQDQELLYGFVPSEKTEISILGINDLSTKRDLANSGIRKTSKPVTPRGIKDLVYGTTEEHNEVVMTAYPDFIVCFDRITDIAVEKQKRMQEFYDKNGINKKIEIVLVEAQKSYLPKIKNDVIREHEAIKYYLQSGKLTDEHFRLMFERKESDFVRRTLQAIHSTSYRDDVWDPQYNARVLDSMIEILDKVSRIVPNEKSRVVLDQVDLLLQRADQKTKYGVCFYDHSYARDIDTEALKDIRNRLAVKAYPYEQNAQIDTPDEDVKRYKMHDTRTHEDE